MTKELLERLEEQGIKLWVEEGKLKFQAPSNVMTENIKSELRSRKEELITYLTEKASPVHDEEKRYEPFALTDIQASYLVGSSSSYGFGGVGCKVYAQLNAPKLEQAVLQQAWEKVVNRHDMLHAVIHENGTQQVMKQYEIPKIKNIDCTLMNENEIEEKLKELERYFLAKQYKPEEWPLYDIVHVQGKLTDYICLCVDMLIADFVSIKIIVNELEKFYFGEEEDKQLTITYRDFLEFQKEAVSKKAYMEAKDYWIKRIDSLPDAPELPVLKQAETSAGLEFEQYNYKIPEKEWMVLEQIGKEYNLTPANILLSVYASVIGLVSGQQNFTINVTMANRPGVHNDIYDIVGDFTTVSLLEVHNEGRKSFLEQAKEIQEQFWKDSKNSQFSGVELMREMNRKGNKNRLFPIVFTSTVGAGKNQGDNRFSLVHKISQTPQVWIDCQISSQNDGVLINWDVRKDIFPKDFIVQAFNQLKRKLKQLLSGKENWEVYQPMELEESVQNVRKNVNNTKGILPDGLLYDGIVENMEKYSNYLAVIDRQRKYTYEKLGLHAAAVQRELMHRNFKAGDIAAIDLEKGIWQIAAMIGVLWAGGTYLPLDWSQPFKRKQEILKDAKARFLITQDKHAEVEIEKIDIDELSALEILDIEPVRVKNTSPAYIIYTSGSTGKPKGVVISHQAALNTITDINERFAITRTDRILALANAAFDLSVYDLFGILSAGGAMVLPEQQKMKDPQYWEELLVKNQVTVWNSVPAQMQMLLLYIQSIQAVRRYFLKTILLSGDWIPVTLPKEAAKVFDGARLVSLGGATEASIWSIYYDINKDETYVNSIPYGRPLRNQVFHVLNKNLAECPDWVIGELYIGGAGLADGYLNHEELTNRQFLVHPDTGERLYRTGDLGRYIEDGIIEFCGREDTQVKIHGHRIELSEIESNIQKMEDVESCAVILNQEEGMENSIVAFIQPKVDKESGEQLVEKEVLGKVMEESGAQASSHIDRNLYEEWSKRANKTAICDIFECFRGLGIFTDDTEYTIEEIQQIIGIHTYYHQLLRRWLNALCTEQIITYRPENKTYCILDKTIPADSNKTSWKKWWDIESKMKYGEKLVQYFQSSSENLLGLLRGEIDSLDLFFPQGTPDIAIAAYHDNMVSQCLNKVMISSIQCMLDAYRKKYGKQEFRILEVGAGVGGASIDLIPALEGKGVKYIFSDISQYFLNMARKRFESYDFVEYQLFDINKPFWAQGMESSSLNLIICNNVLHNAKVVQDVLSRFRDILTDGGALMVADTTGENYSLLTSMEFHAGLSDFDDFRKETDQVFLRREQWKELFEKEHIEMAGMFPAEEDSLSRAYQAVFIGQYKSEQKKVESEEVITYLKQCVPEYMLPGKIEVVHKMQLTENGKIDRKELKKRINQQNPFVKVSGEVPETELEKAIEIIWAKALNREHIWRNENFYQAGGDSLLVAQVVAAMKEQIPQAADWEWDSLMMEIIQTPTIEEVAKKIEQRNEKKSDGEKADKSLVIFSEEEEKKKVKVLFHDGTGTSTPYQYLIPYLKKTSKGREDLIGFVYGEEKEYLSYPTETLIQNLGEKYAKNLSCMDYEEYELIGYCMGGLVAVETAKCLMQEGKTVKPVVTIDTTPCDSRLKSELLMERTYGMLIGADVTACGYFEDEKLLKEALLSLIEENRDIETKDLLSLEGKYAPVAECYRKLSEQTQEERLNTIYESLKEQSGDISKYPKERMNTLFHIISKSFKGMASYMEEPFVGEVIALNCEDKNTDFLPVLETQNRDFWTEMTLGELEMITVPGNHISCMHEPLVQKIADILNQ